MLELNHWIYIFSVLLNSRSFWYYYFLIIFINIIINKTSFGIQLKSIISQKLNFTINIYKKLFEKFKQFILLFISKYIHIYSWLDSLLWAIIIPFCLMFGFLLIFFLDIIHNIIYYFQKFCTIVIAFRYFSFKYIILNLLLFLFLKLIFIFNTNFFLAWICEQFSYFLIFVFSLWCLKKIFDIFMLLYRNSEELVGLAFFKLCCEIIPFFLWCFNIILTLFKKIFQFLHIQFKNFRAKK